MMMGEKIWKQLAEGVVSAAGYVLNGAPSTASVPGAERLKAHSSPLSSGKQARSSWKSTTILTMAAIPPALPTVVPWDFWMTCSLSPCSHDIASMQVPLPPWTKHSVPLLILTRCFLALCCYCFSVTKSCPTLCNPMGRRQPESSVYGISQARILEWVAISLARGSSWPRDRTCISWISCISKLILYHRATREVL